MGQRCWHAWDGASRYWCVADGTNRRVLQSDGSRVPNLPQPSTRGGAVAAFTAILPRHELSRTELTCGQFHARMWRAGAGPAMTQRYEKPWTQSVQGARVLFHEMNECFRYVEPEAKNLGSWGHELRQLLILACTEVESAWKAVLTANQYGASGNLKTNDYVKLLAPMRLDEWEVALPLHVGVAKFRPFKGWKKAKPTKSLDWYNAYNAVKHDRESAFKEATLRRMITAMGAVFVMVSAQFGSWRRVGGGAQSLREMQHLFPTDFLVTKEPKWDPRELYVPPEGGGGHNWTGAGWTEVSCRL